MEQPSHTCLIFFFKNFGEGSQNMPFLKFMTALSSPQSGIILPAGPPVYMKKQKTKTKRRNNVIFSGEWWCWWGPDCYAIVPFRC